ncbi:MAG: response regulator [Chromatiales bacterium]|nr:response regulator [Chromatiales bacterium]
MLVNLLSNAVKYNKDGGMVTISAEVLQGHLKLAITDTGFGIPDEQIGELFEPFTRLGRDKLGIEGTGIGLAVNKALVEAMLGQYGVESSLGTGSTFWISLPMEGPHTDGDESATAQSTVFDGDQPDESSYTVFYIEDDPASRHLLRLMLQSRSGCRVEEASSAEVALQRLKRLRVDVIVMDIHLPGMDGFAALAHLQAQDHTGDVPVIALSADAMPQQRRNGLEKGFFEYLTKPVVGTDLLSAIDRALAIRLFH